MADGLTHLETEFVVQGPQIGAIHEVLPFHDSGIVDPDIKKRRDQANDAVDKIVHPEGTEHIARQHHATLGPDLGHFSPLVDGVIHQKTGLVFAELFLNQHHLGSHRGDRIIPGLLHGLAMNGITEGIVAEGPSVPFRARLQVDHGVVVGTATQRVHQVIMHPFRADRGNMVGHLAYTDTANIANTLNARVVAVDINLVHVFAPLITGNVSGHRKQTGTAGQHLLVIQQALFDGGFKLERLGAKTGFRAVFHQPDGHLPKQ